MFSTISGLCLSILIAYSCSIAQTSNSPCENNPEYAKLDFWVGEWDVVNANGGKAGDNSIRKILNSCAIIEDWTGNGGSKGMSLFYYDPKLKTWKQVWLTQNAVATGGTKEKAMIEEFDNGAVRFQGEIIRPNGSTYIDRTTLTPLPDGRVRQVIETSNDEGETWTTGFDAFYTRKKKNS